MEEVGRRQTDADAHGELDNRDGKASLHCLRRAFQIELRAHADEEQADQRAGAVDNAGGKAADLQRRREQCVDDTAQKQRDNNDAARHLIEPFFNRN